MLKRLLWQRSGGYWLFWVSAVYLIIGLSNLFGEVGIPTELIQVCWIAVLAFPFTYPPLGRWLNLNITWDKDMFNWFGKKDKAPSNVVPFPEKKETKNDYIPPAPKKEKEPHTFYRLGLTDNNRVAFSMGYSEITMNKEGIQQMIDQLEFFQGQIKDEDYEE